MKNLVNSVKRQLVFLLLAGFCLQAKAQWNMIAYSNDSSSCGWEDVFFLNKDTGFVVGCLWPMPYTHPPASILRTHNGGITWDTTLFINTNIEPHQIMSIHCPNDSVCYAVGLKGRLYKTTNGGNSWSWSNTGLPVPVLQGVHFFGNDTGLVCHANNGAILAYTENGGTSWKIDSSFNFSSGGLDFSFPHRNIGYNLGFKTKTGGKTWEMVNTLPHINHPQLNSYKATSFIDSLWGYIAANGSKGFDYGYDVYNFGVIARTKDGGDLWDCKDYPNIRFVNTIQMLNKNEGYFGGTPNQHLRYIFKTENGGDNWYPQELIGKNIYNYYPDIFSIHCPTDSVCYAVGRYQYIYKTTNAGGPLIGVGINESKVQTNALRVYPNPAGNSVTVEWSKEVQVQSLAVFDYLGREVLKEQLPNNTHSLQLDVSALPQGMYFIKLFSHDTNYVEKLLIQK
ncbi:MAG: Ycf48-like protein [Flavobacteriales bacterium]|nr:Ycf48-like protein [Flavobacteriales bacterium]